MSSPIHPGARVLVRWAGLPHVSPCSRRLPTHLPLFQSVGIVDRIDAHRGDHHVIVVFRDLHVPPFGSLWLDVFRPDELVRLARWYCGESRYPIWLRRR
jgi:hypothetical protein